MSGSSGSNGNGRTRSSSSSSSSSAAVLCPTYLTSCPVFHGAVEAISCGSSCLEVLLLNETLGPLPWALQQLAPFRAAQQEGGSTPASGLKGLWVQWPMLPRPMGPISYGSGDSSGSTATQGSSSSNSGGGSQCQCCRPTCHLCAPPPPVTLQELRLLLEVVCLTCHDTTQQAQQAPLLLALLLQRASPGLRAEFLNSADGTRLLAALQQATGNTGTAQSHMSTAWCMFNHHGALSLPSLLGNVTQVYAMLAGQSRALWTLGWCFFEADVSLTAAAAAGPTGGLGVTVPAQAVPVSVAHGSVLRFSASRFEGGHGFCCVGQHPAHACPMMGPYADCLPAPCQLVEDSRSVCRFAIWVDRSCSSITTTCQEWVPLSDVK
jgi:hypothetical protein